METSQLTVQRRTVGGATEWAEWTSTLEAGVSQSGLENRCSYAQPRRQEVPAAAPPQTYLLGKASGRLHAAPLHLRVLGFDFPWLLLLLQLKKKKLMVSQKLRSPAPCACSSGPTDRGDL